MHLDRKSPYVFFLAVILVLAISIALYFQGRDNDTNQPQPNTPQVKITDFSIDEWGTLSGLTMGCKFNLTIQNVGASNVSGLVLNITVSVNGSEIPLGNYFEGAYENGTLIEPLGASEVRACNGVMMSSIGSGIPFFATHPNGTFYEASVSVNGVVLDKRETV